MQLKYIGEIRRRRGGDPDSRHEPVEVLVYPEFREGLEGLQDFSHIYLIYYMDRAGWDGELRRWGKGVFSTRSQFRPNPIGISVVEVLDVNLDSGIVVVVGTNAWDSTPLLDIKPYDLWDRVENPRVPQWYTSSISNHSKSRSERRQDLSNGVKGE